MYLVVIVYFILVFVQGKWSAIYVKDIFVVKSWFFPLVSGRGSK
jgi:hypothetical protein